MLLGKMKRMEVNFSLPLIMAGYQLLWRDIHEPDSINSITLGIY